MPQGFDNPVVFLAFANAAEQGYLSQLKKESALLRDLFLPLPRAGQIELVHEESLDAAEIAETRVSDHEIYYQNDFIFQKTLV